MSKITVPLLPPGWYYLRVVSFEEKESKTKEHEVIYKFTLNVVGTDYTLYLHLGDPNKVFSAWLSFLFRLGFNGISKGDVIDLNSTIGKIGQFYVNIDTYSDREFNSILVHKEVPR